MNMARERRYLFWLTALPVVLAVGLLLTSPSSADAATIVVNHSGEELTANGLCTLLEALANANTDAQPYLDCAAGQGGGIVDTIAFNIPAAQCTTDGVYCTIRPSFPYIVSRPV